MTEKNFASRSVVSSVATLRFRLTRIGRPAGPVSRVVNGFLVWMRDIGPVLAAIISFAFAVFAAGYLSVLHPAAAIIAVIAVGIVWMLSRLDGWRRLYALTLVLLFCVTSSQDQLASAAYYARFAAAGALAFWTYYCHRQESRELKSLSGPLQCLVQGLWCAVAVGGLSTIWSVDRSTTLQHSLALAILALIVHLLVTRRWIESHRIPGDLAVAFFVLVSIFTASIAADVVALPDTRTFDGRFQGLYNNPNMLGMMCLLALPIGWGLYAHTRRKRYLLGLIPTALAVLMSQSRTGIIAIGLGALWILLRKGPRAISQAIGVLAVGAVLIEVVGMRRQASALVDPISSRFADNQGDVFNGRMLGWRDSLQLLQARPTTGYGYAAGPTLFENSRATGVVSFSLDVVHNSYLQWLLELGAVGLVPLLALLFVCVWAVLRGDLGGIGAGLVWAIVAGLLLQTTESAMFGTGQTYPFVFWLVVAGALVRTATKIPPPEPSAGHRIGQESHGHHGETLAGRPL